MLDKSLRRQFRPIEITSRDSVAANVDLSNYTNGYQLTVGIEYINPRIGDRSPNRGWMHSMGVWPDLCRCGDDRAFRWPVIVKDSERQCLGRINVQSISAGEQRA